MAHIKNQVIAQLKSITGQDSKQAGDVLAFVEDLPDDRFTQTFQNPEQALGYWARKAGASSNNGQAGAGAGGGAATGPIQLPAIVEGSAFTPQQYQELNLLMARRIPRAPSASTSATALGQQLLQNCPVNQLVTVSEAGRTAAKLWLTRAGQAGVKMRLAATGGLGLLEKSGDSSVDTVQSVFSALLLTQAATGKYKVHDVHTKQSVCGTLRPDMVVCVGQGAPLPSSTALVLELKRQDGSYCSPSHMLRLSQYGTELLTQLPSAYRSRILLGITDAQKIRFLRVTRHNDDFQFEQSEEIGEVLEALCTVLSMEPEQLQATAPPQLMFGGAPLAFEKLLGAGATSTVYQCEVVLGGRTETVAVKLLQPGHNADTEVLVLQALAHQRCACMPTLVGRLDRPLVGYLLQPVGTTLSVPWILDEYPQLFRSFAALVDTLRTAHGLGWVHRDVRLSNLLAVEDAQAPGGVRLLLMDWGFAVRQGSVIPARQFCGAARSASTRLLEALAQGQDVAATPSDDLESLVKAMFLLSHPQEAGDLHAVPQTEYSRLREVWEKLFAGHPWWAELRSLAEADNYDVVATKLAGRFD